MQKPNITLLNGPIASQPCVPDATLFPSIIANQMSKVGDPSSIGSDAEMTHYLDALLERLMEQHDFSYDELPGPKSDSMKWRYSSAYQKAVRRNDASIKAVAAALNRCDPAYIWRRAPTIALEDISMGDPWVCALVLHACRFAKIRARHGKDELAGFLGELMGRAVKDRLSCDSFCLPCFHPALASVRGAVDAMPVQERADLYRSDAHPYAWRISAGMALAGPRYGGDIFSGAGGSPDQLAEAVQGLVPYAIQWISRQYARMARDGMFVSLPLVWMQLTSEAQAKVVQRKLPNRLLIEGVLSATFDGHTHEGRKAFAYFAKSCEPIKEFFGADRAQTKLIGLAVFTVDSSILDRSVTSPWGKALYEENLQGEVLAAGMSPDRFAELTSIVAANLHKLNIARYRVVA